MKEFPSVPIGVNRVICGDCIDEMQKFPAACIDTIITDPPYGLGFMGKEWDKPGMEQRTAVQINSILPAGGEAAHKWEPLVYQKWSVQWAKECLRVARPGTFMLIFGGTRTFHRLACAIEDAGWQIRDCMMWLYGSGFPKSHNIGKAIDKLRGFERKTVGVKQHAKKDFKNNLYAQDPANANNKKIFGYGKEELTKGNSEWEGYGTTLKPAWEPIIVAMKPLDGTFAQNAEKHSVAGLWIDGGRIEGKPWKTHDATGLAKNKFFTDSETSVIHKEPHSQGRWPANLILDEEAGKMLDEQSGFQKGGNSIRKNNKNPYGSYRTWSVSKTPAQDTVGYTDSGGASRFFYCAKASKKERGKDNNHPTVKPLALMEYLCKLTKTPTGGIVLDPFGGSGTTALACIKTGRKYVLIEKEQEYVEIARQRIKVFSKNK